MSNKDSQLCLINRNGKNKKAAGFKRITSSVYYTTKVCQSRQPEVDLNKNYKS